MATQTLPGDVRPAKIAYFPSRASAATAQQQQAVEGVIASDRQERLFSRHPAGGCLSAMECAS